MNLDLSKGYYGTLQVRCCSRRRVLIQISFHGIGEGSGMFFSTCYSPNLPSNSYLFVQDYSFARTTRDWQNIPLQSVGSKAFNSVQLQVLFWTKCYSVRLIYVDCIISILSIYFDFDMCFLRQISTLPVD